MRESHAPRRPLRYALLMTDKPPADPAAHAEDFARRYAEDLEIVAGQAMIDMRLTDRQTGVRDPTRGLAHHCFLPHERTGGGVNRIGQVNVDSGVMNPELLAENYDQAAQDRWKRTRLGDRAQAIIAHELAEYEHGGDHELALIAAPETDRAISHAARELLRAMESGWMGG